MNNQLFLKIGLGMMLLGVFLVIFDLYISNLLKRMYPHALKDIEDDAAKLPIEEAKKFKEIQAYYKLGTSKLARKAGVLMCIFGLLVATIAYLSRSH
jgi:hypothetical protein